MAVTVTDTRTTIDEADATTGWTGSATPSVYTSAPNPVESTGSLGQTISNTTGNLYHLHSSAINMSGTGYLVYVWVLANGIMDTKANGGITIQLGENSTSGTDRVGYHLAGSDAAGFRHDQASVGWQCLLLDTSGLPTGATAYSGTVGGLDISNIDKFGSGFKTLAKALGGVENCFTDVVRYGNDGLIITGGTSGDPGQFAEIAIEDRSSTSGKAYGIIRELGAGLFGLQGPLTFGDGTGTGASYFADTDATVVFEDRDIGTDKYYIKVVGNSTGSATFKLGTQVGSTTTGSNGCTLICPTGVGAYFDATDADIDYVYIYGSTLSGFNNGVDFSTDTTNGPNHQVYGSAFIGCGQIDPGKVQFKNNQISNTTDSTTGAVLLDADGTSRWEDLVFNSGGTGHAIYITATGTYDFTNFNFSGYSTASLGSNLTASSGSTDAMVYNNSGGSVTINISGGDNISVRNGASATTTVVSSVTYTVTVQDSAANAIVGAQVAIFKTSDDSVIHASSPTDASGQISGSVSASTGAIYIRARQSTNTATFNTNTGVNGSTETITTDTTHSFVDGEAVVYSKNGGSAAIGLTDGTTYYLNSTGTTTLQVYDTAANAIGGGSTGRVDLTASGSSETHSFDPVRYYPTSTVGTVGTTNFAVTITMIEDTTVTG